MDCKTINTKLETLKNCLVCACLLVVLMTSCSDSRRDSELLNTIVRLQSVSEETIPCNDEECQDTCPRNETNEDNEEGLWDINLSR